jgi:hypothetical protein
MTDIIKETVTTQTGTVANTVATANATKLQTTQYLIYFVFGVFESLLAIRFFFKLAGASHASGFVLWIYNVTQFFIAPFEGIFRKGVIEGSETTSIFEPATLLTIGIYALLAYGIVSLVTIASGKKPDQE